MIKPEYFRFPQFLLIFLLLLQLTQLKVPFQAFDLHGVFDYFLGIELNYLGLKSAVLQFIILLSASCLSYGSLLGLQLLFQLF